MKFERTVVDEQPFGDTGTGGATMVRVVGGESLGRLVEGDTANAFRRRTEHWAKARAFVIADSIITHCVDGVTALVPLYSITEGTAVVKATAVQPVSMSLAIEPKRWTHRLRARFGGKAFESGDASFDRGWQIDATDEEVARQVVDEELMDTIREASCWSRAVYEAGNIEVRLDSDRLAGTHILSGIEIVLLLARARPQTSAYR